MSEELAVQPAVVKARHPFGAAWLRARLEGSLAFLSSHALTFVELGLILACAAIVTRPYLSFDPSVVPAGREYLFHLTSHHLWTRAQECGLCALWNGSARGGYPAFADIQSSALHPYVMVATLLFGVINGGKVVLLLAFFTAGVAQWWLGRSLGLARPIRTWTALMAVAGGQLAGRMENGVLGLVLALASCSLALAALVALVQSGTRRAAVLFGIAFALALLSGQGYIQIGFVLLLPLAVVLVRHGPLTPGLLARRAALGLGLGLLLSAPLILPALRFLPEFGKNIDPQFQSAQPLKFAVLNLLIDDGAFHRIELLRKMTYPWLYAYFIGWIPFILGIWGVASGRAMGRPRLTLFLGLTAFGALWLATAVPLAWLARIMPVESLKVFIYGIRFTPLFTALAVPAILALAGLGVARLLAAHWPRFDFGLSDGGQDQPVTLRLDLRWLLVIPLLLALRDTYEFNRQYISNTRLSEEIPAALAALKTPDLQWVNPPFGEQYWMETATAMGLKASIGTQGWAWREHEPPPVVRELSRSDAPPAGMTLAGQVGGLYLYAAGPGREYAAVTGQNGSRTVCSAQGVGGDIDIACDAPVPGVLTVLENTWPGWQAAIDGQKAEITGKPWIALRVPAGRHTISLRYRPFDALAGVALAVLGLAWAVYLWFRKDSPVGPRQEAA